MSETLIAILSFIRTSFQLWWGYINVMYISSCRKMASSVGWESALSLLLRALKFSCMMRICTVSRSNAYVTSTINGWFKLSKILKERAVERAGIVLHYHHSRCHRRRLNLVVWKNCQYIFTLSRRTRDIYWAVSRESIFPRSSSAKP